MKNKSKLAIKHYHGKELEKIAMSNASRFGMRFEKQSGRDARVLDSSTREMNRFVEAEVWYIEMLKDHFEGVLAVEFTPSMVVNNFYENTTLKKVIKRYILYKCLYVAQVLKILKPGIEQIV